MATSIRHPNLHQLDGRDPLRELDSRRVQLDRVEMEQRLATALRSLGWQLTNAGRSDEGVSKLSEAVEIFRQVSWGRTREYGKLAWAQAEWDLGQASYQLGVASYELGLQDSAQPLRDAVEAYSQSLLERPRDQVPQLWAQTMAALGAAEWELGLRTKKGEELSDAMTSLCAAREAYFRGGVPDDAHGLERGIHRLASDIADMSSASRAVEDVSAVCTQKEHKRS